MDSLPRKAFGIIPEAVWNQVEGLPHSARAVYLYLVSRKGVRGEVFPSYGTMAKMTGYNRRTVMRAITILEGFGLAERIKPSDVPNRRRTNSYRLPRLQGDMSPGQRHDATTMVPPDHQAGPKPSPETSAAPDIQGSGPDPNKITETDQTNNTDAVDTLPTWRLKLERWVGRDDADRWVQKWGAGRVQSVMREAEKRAVQSPAGWIWKALTEGWHLPSDDPGRAFPIVIGVRGCPDGHVGKAVTADTATADLKCDECGSPLSRSVSPL